MIRPLILFHADLHTWHHAWDFCKKNYKYVGCVGTLFRMWFCLVLKIFWNKTNHTTNYNTAHFLYCFIHKRLNLVWKMFYILMTLYVEIEQHALFVFSTWCKKTRAKTLVFYLLHPWLKKILWFSLKFWLETLICHMFLLISLM